MPSTTFELPESSKAFIPEFLSIADAVKRFGIGRSMLFQLISERRIKSVSLRRPGCVRGRRLIVTESLRNYLLRHVEGGDGE